MVIDALSGLPALPLLALPDDDMCVRVIHSMHSGTPRTYSAYNPGWLTDDGSSWSLVSAVSCSAAVQFSAVRIACVETLLARHSYCCCSALYPGTELLIVRASFSSAGRSSSGKARTALLTIEGS